MEPDISVGRRTMSRTLRLVRVLAATGLLFLVGFPGSAAATSSQMTTPFTAVVTNPCNGDVVNVTGNSHVVMVMNGNKAEIQTNWPDTSGVSTTGVDYQVNDATHLFVLTVPDGGFTIGFRDSFELVSKDPSANFLVHESVEIIFNPKTGFAAKIRGAGAECSGPQPAP
jgi:hypothetical protein